MQLAVWYGARLQVLHVMPPLPPSAVSGLAATTRQLTARNVRAVVDRCQLPNVDAAAELVESDEPAARIVDEAEAFDADLIVTGSHGRSGMQRALLGSVVEALLHRSSRPVMVIPSHVDHIAAANQLSRIVCAIDFSMASLDGLALALSMAEEAAAQLTLLHVIETPPELAHPPQPPDLDVAAIRASAEANCLAQLQTLIPAHAREYCSVETAVLEGGASRQLLRTAADHNADLIVLGVLGRNAFDLAFFGSTSKDVVRMAHCPVLIVPATRRPNSQANTSRSFQSV